MTVKTKRISTLINSQLPEFISSEYEMFGKFIEKYYESLEIQGGTLDVISNIQKYLDIDFYEKNILKQNDVLASSLTSSDTTITLEDAKSFPEKNGYVKIDNEIIFYASRTNTELQDCSRGVSGNTTIGDLYNESNFKTTDAAVHSLGSKVYNVSNLFLYAFVRNFESQYLNSFPEKYLKRDIDKRTLIKNIQKFYKSKGTESSIRFIFNAIIDDDSKPSTYSPVDFTLKNSTSDWVNTYTLKAKLVSGNINDIIGKRIVQNDENYPYASAVVDNIKSFGSSDGEVYELVLSPASINGEFRISSQTKLKKIVDASDSIGDRVNVESTLGWKKSGSFIIGNEAFKFVKKNAAQFYIEERSSSITHDVGTPVYDYSPVAFGDVELIIFGVLYEFDVSEGAPYSIKGDRVQVKDAGFTTTDRILFDKEQQSYRWYLNESNTIPSIANTNLQTQANQFIADVSAIYEDGQTYYICSSGYPSYEILSANDSATLVDPRNLKIIRKTPISTPEVYETNNKEVGIFLDGTIAFGYKDEEFVKFGNIEKINVISKGDLYERAPYVLINDLPNKAQAVLSGSKLNSVTITDTSSYTEDPTVTITSGRNAQVTPIVTNGEITSLVIDNPGEYYSSPPVIRITDTNGKGKFAEYEAVVSFDGKLTDFVQINKGRLYSINTVSVDVIPQGSGATVQAEIKKWVKNRYKKVENSIDTANGCLFSDYEKSGKKRYGIVADPIKLRARIGDNLDNFLQEPTQKTHSKILGYAFDGNPIYGPFGYENAADKDSTITRLQSGYSLNSSRQNGPSTTDYPLGTFIDDYQWTVSNNSGYTRLDKNNGRFCITPEYPEGTYAYFVSSDSNNNPTFPYILGKNYYSVPLASNYDANISQDEIPKSSKRLNLGNLSSNGFNNSAIIQSVKKGSITTAIVEDSTDIFSVDNELNLDSILLVNDKNTGGNKAAASVSEIFGRKVESIESVQTIPLKITTKFNVYFFDGDIVTQESTGYTGEVVGDSFNTRDIVLRSVTGLFNAENKISSDRTIINVLLDQDSSFKKGSIIELNDGDPDNPAIAVGEVLETTTKQNNLKVKVTSGSFIINDDYTIRSNNLADTIGSKINSINSLSDDIEIFSVFNNIALVKTEDNHRLSVDDNIDIDIIPNDSNTETTYYIRKRKYQQIKLTPQTYSSVIVDTGIGKIDTMIAGFDYASTTNGGATFTDVEVLFSNIEKSRNSIGQTVGNSDTAVIGKAGSVNNAKATVVVGFTYTASNSNAALNQVTLSNTTNVFSGMGVRGNNIAAGTVVLSVNRDTNVVTLQNNSTSPISGVLTDIVFNPGIVTSVTITSKGSDYRRGDSISFASSDLDKGNNQNARDYLALVDHAGVSTSNTVIKLNGVIGLSINDLLKIGSEIVKITAVDTTNNTVTVERAQNNTSALDHYDGGLASLTNAEYRFIVGTHLFNQDASDPYVYDYDKNTNLLTLYYDYGVSSTNNISSSNLVTDQSFPVKNASVTELISLYNKFEYSDDNTNFKILNDLELQRNYSYKFDTSHSSMTNTFFEVSPSFNRNLVSVDSFRNTNSPGTSNSFVKFKPGQTLNQLRGSSEISSAISNNSIVEDKINVEYSRYYFYDVNDTVDVTDSYFDIVSDPLAGKKKLIFVTDTSFAYSYTSKPQYDASSGVKYSTTNKSAVGKIKSVKIDNVGQDYEVLPTIFGVVPSRELQCIIDLEYNAVTKTISSINLVQSGANYVKPKAIILGEGTGGKIDLVKIDGKIVAAVLKDGGRYTQPPTVKIVETSVQVYLQSDNIGIPESIKVDNAGYLHNTDNTLLREYCSHTSLILSNVSSDAFSVGEKVLSEQDGVVYASGIVSDKGWKAGRNVLRVKNVSGAFIQGMSVISNRTRKTGNIDEVLISKFEPKIKSYYDNIGYYKSTKGQIGENFNRLTDSNFYQDFSYVIKSKTPIDVWRNLIKETTHPAGFKMFGEVLIETKQTNSLQQNPKSAVNHSIINLAPQQVSELADSRIIKSTFINFKDTNQEIGHGTVSVDNQSNTETYATEVTLTPEFDGIRRVFSVIDKSTNAPIVPYNEQQLIITIDGVFQEPKVSYTVTGSNIIFTEPPFGERVVEDQTVPAQSFYGRSFKFKSDSLNEEYLKKIRNFFQRSGTWIDAANQTKFNKNFIKEESLGYVIEKYPSIPWNQYRSKCSRDIGYFVDALEHDLRFGGNSKTISAASSYYNGSSSVKHITDQITESLDAFKYAAKLCAAAARNWDYTVTNAIIAPNGASDIIQVDSTFGIVVGMNISSGAQYPEGTKVIEIVSDTRVKVSNNVNPYAATPLIVNSDTTLTQSQSNAGVQVNDPNFLQVGTVNASAVSLTSVDSVYSIPQVTFSLSKINNGTFYDASNLIERNKKYIQEETLGWIKNQYPSLSIPNEDKCQRDTGYLVDAVVYSLRYGGTKKIINFAKSYYVGNKVKYINNELTESVAAYGYAFDLMILSMKNTLPNGTYTSVTPFTDSSILSDPNELFSGKCIEVESSLNSYSGIISKLLTDGINLIQPEPENNQRSGNWTSRRTYSNYNILPDPKLISNPEYPSETDSNSNPISKECDDVVSALSSLYGGIESVLNNGIDSVIKTNADYINNETKEFDLYYENSSVVKTDPTEELLIFINSVLQLPGSYKIIRSSDPSITDKVAFTEVLKWQQNLNTITVQEPLAVDKCYVIRVGSYEKLTIKQERISIKKSGPFIIFDAVNDIPRKIDNSKYAFVFIDGVLQKSTSYIISGSTISFKEKLQYHILDDGNQITPKIDILLIYGRDIEKQLTFYDFEPDNYFNKIELEFNNLSQTAYDSIIDFFINSAPIYYNISKSKQSVNIFETNSVTNKTTRLGVIKKIFADIATNKFNFTISGNNLIDLDPNGTYTLSPDSNVTNVLKKEFTISNSVTITSSYSVDSDTGLRRLPRNASPYAYDNSFSEDEWDQIFSLQPKLKAGDIIKVDGESATREITQIPRFAFSKENRPGKTVDNSIYAKVSTTNYNGFSEGIGLGVIAELTNGSITNLIWNNRDFSLLDAGIIDKATTSGYFASPNIEFVPVDNNGGGAVAEVLAINGMIVDVILINGGSGYTQPPQVIVSRNFFIDKKPRKIDYYLSFASFTVHQNVKIQSVITSSIRLEVGGYLPDGFVSYASVISPESISQERIRDFVIKTDAIDISPESVEVVSVIDLSDQIQMSTESSIEEISVLELNRDITMNSTTVMSNTETAFVGAVDVLYNNYPSHYTPNILGNRLTSLESFKFMTTGYSDVSEVTIGEFSDIYPNLTIGNFALHSGNTVRTSTIDNIAFNTGYPSTQNYGTLTDVGVNSTDSIIYVSSTSAFPNSGSILLGKEVISYTSKLSDRFLNVTRGVNAESHLAGTYVRTF